MNDLSLDELKRLYNNVSKHSNYQVLSRKLSKLIGKDELLVKTRFEAERLTYILDSIQVERKTGLDIGGNTGYFTFELLEHGAKSICYYEGNESHADFVRLAADMLNLKDKVEVRNRYFSFGNELKDEHYDFVLLLNVLHHVGDDYGEGSLAIEQAKQLMISQLNSFVEKTDYVVFQLGFNWKGNVNEGLFKNGTKREMIDFIEAGIKDSWNVLRIGIAERTDAGIVYKDMNNNNIGRNDSLGEFLNRPLFILKSKWIQ